jgi:hypothetical protein
MLFKELIQANKIKTLLEEHSDTLAKMTYNEEEDDYKGYDNVLKHLQAYSDNYNHAQGASVYELGKGDGHVKYGRMYPSKKNTNKGLTIANMKRGIKNALTQDVYIDFDMQNAMPVILSQLYNKHVTDKQDKPKTPNQTINYINNRETLIKEEMNKSGLDYTKAKDKVKTSGFCAFNKSYASPYECSKEGFQFNPHKHETKQDSIAYEMYELYKATNKKTSEYFDAIHSATANEPKLMSGGNKQGKAISALYRFVETKMMVYVIHQLGKEFPDMVKDGEFYTCIYEYDGLRILEDKITNVQEVLDFLTNKCKNFGFDVVWTTKDHKGETYEVSSWKDYDFTETTNASHALSEFIKTWGGLTVDTHLDQGTEIEGVLAKVIAERLKDTLMFVNDSWYSFDEIDGIKRWREYKENRPPLSRLRQIAEHTSSLLTQFNETDGNASQKEQARAIHNILVRKLLKVTPANAVYVFLREYLKRDDVVFNSDRSLRGYENVVYDAKLMAVRDYRCTDYITSASRHSFIPKWRGTRFIDDEGTLCELPGDETTEQEEEDFGILWDALEEIQPEPEELDFLLTYLSTIFTEIKPESFCIALGEGSNGKSFLMKLMETILGPDYYYNLPVQVLCGRNDLDDGNSAKSALYHTNCKRFINISEPSSTASINNDLFKALTGNDRMSVRDLNKSQEQIHLHATYFMDCNNLPFFKEDAGKYDIKRRVILQEYKSTFKFGAERDETKRLYPANEKLKSDAFLKSICNLFDNYLMIKSYSYTNLEDVKTEHIKKISNEYCDANSTPVKYFNMLFVKTDDKDYAMPTRTKKTKAYTLDAVAKEVHRQIKLSKERGEKEAYKTLSKVKDTLDEKLPFKTASTGTTKYLSGYCLDGEDEEQEEEEH